MGVTSSQAEFVAALFNAADPLPAGLTTARGKPDMARFGVYRNNVLVALIGALEQRFPVMRRLVGDEFFRMMAHTYIHVSKPTTPLMFQYGDDFPAFAVNFEAVETVPYLGDVGRLEKAWSDSYHSADAKPLETSALSAIELEQLLTARLIPHPATVLIHSPFPIGSIWEAHQRNTVSSPAHWGPETLVVVRPNAGVRVHILPKQDADFAAAVLAGTAIGDAAEAASQVDGFDFGRSLMGLIALGAFQEIKLSPKN